MVEAEKLIGKDEIFYCPICGKTQSIEDHHNTFRSQGGSDDPENLSPICWECHQKRHREQIEITRNGNMITVVDKEKNITYSRNLKQGFSEEDGKRAFQKHLVILNIKWNLEQTTLELAALLKEMRDTKLFKVLDYEYFEDYIASPELSFHRSWVYRIIGVYERYILELNIDMEELIEADINKLEAAKNVVNEENVDDVLADVRELSQSDMIAKYRGGEPPKPTIPKVITVCPSCGGQLICSQCGELQ